MDKKSVMEMSGGAILERVDYEMGKIIDNIMDPNTKATAKRKVTVTLEIVPDDDRTGITVHTVAKSTLAPTNPIMTALYVTGDRSTGEVQVVEMVPQIPGQAAMDGQVQEEPKVLKFAKQA